MIRVDRIGADDWQAWRGLRLRALSEAPEAFGSRLADVDDREAAWRGRIDAAEACFLAFVDGAAVGMVAADPADDGVALQSMFVAPEARRSGVAARLVAAVAAVASGRPLVLGVMHENRGAIRAYEQAGFVPDDGVTGVDCEVTMRFVPPHEETSHAR